MLPYGRDSLTIVVAGLRGSGELLGWSLLVSGVAGRQQLVQSGDRIGRGVAGADVGDEAVIRIDPFASHTPKGYNW